MATFRELIESALPSSGVSGAIPKEIRATLVEQNRVLNPMYALIPRFATATNKYFWVTRTALPYGGPSLEAPPLTGIGSVPEYASTYGNNNSVNIRNLTFRGNVGKITEQVATRVGSIIAKEMMAQAENEARIETILNLYGSENATALTNKIQWSGMDQQIGAANKIKVSGALALATLDSLYDQVRTAVGVSSLGNRWAFVMSHPMQTALNALYSTTTRTNLPIVDAKGIIDPDVFGQKDSEYFADRIRAMAGVEVLTYRGVPIIPTGFIQPTGTMGSVTIGAGAASGTTFPGAQAYYYQVEAVTVLGKTVACTEVTRTPASGASVLLSWTTPTITDRFGNAYPILHYRIFRSTTTGTETYYATVAGYDANDNPVTTWTDTNAVNDPLNGGTGTAYVPLAGAGDLVTVPASTSKTEDIFLWPLDPDIAGMAVLNEMNQEQLAPITSRSIQFETTADMALTIFTGAFAAQATGVTHA